MRDYLQGKRCMVWSFMGNTRMYQALRDYGDRLDTVGIFTFEVDATGTISETGTSISTMLTYINKWPHIKWMLTVMNHGTASIFTALRNNTDGAKDTFLTELVRIIPARISRLCKWRRSNNTHLRTRRSKHDAGFASIACPS